MAEGEGGSNTGIVAIFVIFLLVLILLFFGWRGGMFGGKSTKVDVDVSVPGTNK